MRKRLTQAVIAGLLILTIGGHWAFLQSVAWVGMIVNYSATDTFARAVQKTFDGEHPCGLCHFVTAGKKAEKKQEHLTGSVKFDLWSVPASALLFPPGTFEVPHPDPTLPVTRTTSPPTPPPRLA